MDHDLANVDEDEEKGSKCKQQALKRLPVLNLLSFVFISVVGLDLQLAGNDATQKRNIDHLQKHQRKEQTSGIKEAGDHKVSHSEEQLQIYNQNHNVAENVNFHRVT